MTRWILTCAVLLLSMAANARTWTDTQGKTLEAKIVWVNANKEVKLKTQPGEIIIVPFSTFAANDIEHLEYLLSRKGRGKLHRVPWNKMNALFGLEVWQDETLWDDPTDLAARRLHLRKESKTAFMENHRGYPLGRQKVLREPVYTSVLYGGEEYVDSLSLVFLNQGDIPPPEYVSSEFIEEMTQQIEESGMRVHDTIVSVLGEPKRDTIGRGNMREKVWRWDWNDHAIMLVMQEGKYVMLHILPVGRADRSGKVDKIKDSELKKRMASCVTRRDNGDVVVQNIPMINQGPKGYCSPATWERYLRYLGIPANMYQLALVGNTEIGGGTYADEMIDATRGLLSNNGRRLEEIGTEIELELIEEQIDQGMPIMWHFESTPSFQIAVNKHTARRAGKTIKTKRSDEDGDSGGHICLIVGYNKETDEIAISDSWGPRFAERWVSIDRASGQSSGYLNIIKW